MSADNVQCRGTTAEVAGAMSNLSDRQLLIEERCFRRRICLTPNRANPGPVQKMRRTVIMEQEVMLCCREEPVCLLPVLDAHRDFCVKRGYHYEEDALYYAGQGTGDP